jgi:hypothetical protein
LKVASHNVVVTESEAREYGLSAALRARLMGISLTAVGVVVLVVSVVVLLADLPSGTIAGLLVLAAIGVVSLALLLGRRWYVVRLDDTGYRVRLVRGVGRASARWTEVEDLTTAVVSGTQCVVLRLRDGQTTTVPVNLIEGDREEFVDELQRRLDRGHGYRRL